ncbi:hypothetical protein FJT64_002231 [Amphibalanus amphitrite]|uniref:Uncharacterized protein n=1 Tax=Amphibalanus amphitrite TaxID=1232801 RepID=A0A6A4WV63_AMPAM|nr:hypothetical protein FJT64_002231 [Amphibalanus amphitrite]
MDGVTKRTTLTLPNWQTWMECCAPPLLLSSEHQLLQWYYHCRTGAYHQQCYLLQALLVAPADIMCATRLTAVRGGLHTWDAAPLLATLTDRDMCYLTGDPSAAAAWCRRRLTAQLDTPRGRAELNTPRGRAELLLQPELLARLLTETVPERKAWLEKSDRETPLVYGAPLPACQKYRQRLEKMLACSEGFVPHLKPLPGMDENTAITTTRVWQLRVRHLLTGDRFERQFWAAIRGSVGRWKLRQHVLGGITADEHQTSEQESHRSQERRCPDEEEQRFEGYVLKVAELVSRQALELKQAQAASEDESQDDGVRVEVVDLPLREQRPVGQEQRPYGQEQRPDGQEQRPAGQEQRLYGQEQRPAGGEPLTSRGQVIRSRRLQHTLELMKMMERHQKQLDELDRLERDGALHEHQE